MTVDPKAPLTRKKSPASPPKLAFSIEEAADAIGVSRSKFCEMMADDRYAIPRIKAGGRVLIPVEALSLWLLENVGVDHE